MKLHFLLLVLLSASEAVGDFSAKERVRIIHFADIKL